MTVTDIQNSLLKYKRPLALFVAIVVLLCHFYLGFSQTYTATVYIKYVGENAENGQAANGSVLKPYEITDSYVVGEALKQLGINDIKASSLAQKITVTPVISKAEQEKYASWIDQFSSYEETEDNKLNPVYYCIQFESDDGIQFARDFLGALVQQYRIYYAQKYVGERIVVAETEPAILNADYFIATQRLQGRLETNMDYLRTIVNGDKNYRSPSTGYSISDLIDAHDFLLETRLAPVNRYILDLGISKDADTLIYKFRTMVFDSEIDTIRWSYDEDPRVTPLGRILRKYHIDELPQLWDIFRGVLSFVGPRPEREVFYDAFETYIHGFRERLKVKPGLTGLAQVTGGSLMPPEEKIVCDIEYIRNRSFVLDLKLMIRTAVVVLGKVFSNEQ